MPRRFSASAFFQVRKRFRRAVFCTACLAGCIVLRFPLRAEGTGALDAGTEAALPGAATSSPAGDGDDSGEGGRGGISGSVADTSGALIPGATVTLRGLGEPLSSTATSDAEGRYSFPGLHLGEYELTVSAPGFANFTSKRIALREVEPEEIVEIRLPVPAGHVDATVTVTRREIAGEEIHAAEKQRVLGIFPNFYTSFVWNAEPLDTRQKFSLALHATLDPVAFLTAGVVAGGEQLGNTFPDYGPGFPGYAKRYGAAYADGFTGKIIGSALLPSLFRQDPRYFYMGTGTYTERALYALASGVLTRGDNGRPQPSYSHVLGNAAAGALSSVYHPASDSAGKLALDNALIGIAGEAAVNLCREFLLKPFTHGIRNPAAP